MTARALKAREASRHGEGRGTRRWCRWTLGGDSQEGSPSSCCTRKGPGVGDRDSLDLGCSGSVTRDKGKDVLGVHPGDGLWVESEDPSLSHPPQEGDGHSSQAVLLDHVLSAPPPSAIGLLLHGRAQNCPGSVTPDPSPGCPSPASRRTPLSVSPADLPRLMPWAPSLMWEEQTPHPGVSFAPGGLGLGLMSPWPPGFLHPITASTSPLHLPGLDAVLCAPSQPLPPANLGPAPTCLCRPYPCEKTGSQGAQQDLRE